jgi:chitodextrinase
VVVLGGCVVTSRQRVAVVSLTMLTALRASLAAAALPAPSSLTAAALGTTAVHLTWNDNASGETGFAVQRSLNANRGFVRITVAASNTTSFTDQGLAPGTTYYYRVRAVGPAGSYSKYSNTAKVTTPSASATPTASPTNAPTPLPTQSPGRTPSPTPSPKPTPSATSTPRPTPTATAAQTPSPDGAPPSVPGGLSASPTSCGQITLAWSASTDSGGSGLKGYNVYRNAVFLKQVAAPATATSDAGLQPSTVYSYSVSAVDNAGNQSGMSSAVGTNTPACARVPLGAWSRRLGGTDYDLGYAVAVDAAGDVVVGGSFRGTVDLGGGPLTSAGSDDVFLVKYSPAGTHLWSKRFGGNGSDVAKAVAVDSGGNVAIAGRFSATIDLGGGALTSAGGDDIFVAVYDPAGNPLWSRRFGGPAGDQGQGVAFDRSGNVILTGYFNGSADFGGGALNAYFGAGDIDSFLAKFSPQGTHLWSENFLNDGQDKGAAVACDSQGNIVLGGQFTNVLNLGGADLDSPNGYSDAFIGKFDASGRHLWSRSFGGSSNDAVQGVAVDPSDDVLATGFFTASADLGGGSVSSAGSSDVFVVKYTPAGAYLWSKRFGGTGSDMGNAVAADTDGNVVVTGSFSNTVDFGNGALTAAGTGLTTDAFVVKLSPSASSLWSKRFGDTLNDAGAGVALDASGMVAVTGYFNGTVDFGYGPTASLGGSDGFLTTIAP